MHKWRIESAVCNNIGKSRGNNEDNFCLNGQLMEKNKMDAGGLFTGICNQNLQIYAVCDGMGGGSNGEDASYTVVSSIARLLKNGEVARDADSIRDMLQNISDQLYSKNAGSGEVVGTTLSMAIFSEKGIDTAHVGDSRIYRLRNRKLTQLTVDQTEVQRMISIGILTKEEARHSPKRHIINQYMGMPPQVKLSPLIELEEPVMDGDRYLLCSDGLHDVLEDDTIAQILLNATEPAAAAKTLTERVLQGNGKDNITAMCLFVHLVETQATPNAKVKHKGKWLDRILIMLICFGVGCMLGMLIDFLCTYYI